MRIKTMMSCKTIKVKYYEGLTGLHGYNYCETCGVKESEHPIAPHSPIEGSWAEELVYFNDSMVSTQNVTIPNMPGLNKWLPPAPSAIPGVTSIPCPPYIPQQIN